MIGVLVVLGVLALPLAVPTGVRAEGPAVEPEATRILKKMTDYLGSLQRFSMDTYNLADDVLMSGQKIQYDLTASVVIQRPNRLRAEQKGDLIKQMVVYDGKTLSIYNANAGYYASVEAPDNIDDLLHFARDTLDIVPPSGDLIFTNSYELLTANITSGVVVGKSVIDGVRCDHIAFTSPLVDFQVWIADGDKPLPYKYVLTTNDDPVRPQDITLVSNWNTAPKVREAMFDFTPPKGAKKTEFLRMDTGDAPLH